MMKQGKKTNAQVVQMLSRKHDAISKAVERDNLKKETIGCVLSELNSQIENYTSLKEKSLTEALVTSESVSEAKDNLKKKQEQLKSINCLISSLQKEFDAIQKEKEDILLSNEENIKKHRIEMDDFRKASLDEMDIIKKELNKKIDKLDRAKEKIAIKDIEIQSKINQMKILNKNILSSNNILREKEDTIYKMDIKIKDFIDKTLEFKLTEQKLKKAKEELKDLRRNK